MNTCNFPFGITQEMEDAFLAHTDYVMAGLSRGHSNDYRQGWFQSRENLVHTIRRAATQHFGEDEDAYWKFEDSFELDETTTGLWLDILINELLKEAA